MKYLRILSLVLGLTVVSGSAAEESSKTDHAKEYRENAKALGWLREYEVGRKMLEDLAAKHAKKGKVAIDAYRNKVVALPGTGAPPGGTNDMLTDKGFYVRVVVPGRKDLRPKSAMWEVFVRGMIAQVYVENKLIVLEVSPEDWEVLQTW